MRQPSDDKTVEDISENDFLDSIDAEDFVFVIDKDGDLKTLVLPDEFKKEDMPENINAVLQVFGVANLNPITLH